MVEIKQILFSEYLLSYFKIFPVSLSFLEQKNLNCKKGAVILLAVDNNIPIGMAFAWLDSSVKFSVYFISIISNVNGSIVEAALLEHCVYKALNYGAEIIEYHRTFPFEKCIPFDRINISINFVPLNHVFGYTLPLSKNNLYHFSDFWDKRGQRILQRLKHKGYTLYRLSEISNEILHKLYSEIGFSFPPKFDPRSCSGISDKYSSIVLKNNEPAAFCIVSLNTSKKEIIIEQLSEKNNLRNSGIFLLPLYHIFKLCLNNDFQYLSYYINVENNEMLGVQNHSFNFMKYIITDYCVYRYILPHN